MITTILNNGLLVRIVAIEYVASTPFRNLEINGFDILLGESLLLSQWEAFEVLSPEDFLLVFSLVLAIAEVESEKYEQNRAELRAWLRSR